MFDHKWNLQWFRDRVKGRENTFACTAGICVAAGCRTVLDVGGGPGLLKDFLPQEMEYTVVDLSPKAAQIGIQIYTGVMFITGQIKDVINNYDAVISLSLIHHLESYEGFLKAIWERTNKVMIISLKDGLNEGNDEIRPNRSYANYWENRWSIPNLHDWISTELNPTLLEIRHIEVDRDYSPELIFAAHKIGGL